MVEIEVPECALDQSPKYQYICIYFHIHCIQIELVAKQRGELVYLRLVVAFIQLHVRTLYAHS